MQLIHVLNNLYTHYQKTTPRRLKLIDAYLGYILVTGIAQFVYGVLFGTFPFNAFISGFVSTVTSFVLAVSLRIQVNPREQGRVRGRERGAGLRRLHLRAHRPPPGGRQLPRLIALLFA
ncbi:Dolichyl-diphosphooligosaccharide--protein glycosyltransferase subunit dad-1-like, protein [Aphelenchoides fujianensis]|nr:Dolichyl-diphosphooligosaccharide--protein glycosyltransferase subunit dad-1-like, protein [Aphelenchoides fujianensis]